jgi:hypothetical protein
MVMGGLSTTPNGALAQVNYQSAMVPEVSES